MICDLADRFPGIAEQSHPQDTPEDGEGAPNDQEWAAMREACETGDWDAMAETAEETHGEDLEDMPCHDDTDHADQEETLGDDNHSGGTWGHMGEGMMGGGHVMSMGW